jgi:hypothetical protein
MRISRCPATPPEGRLSRSTTTLGKGAISLDDLENTGSSLTGIEIDFEKTEAITVTDLDLTPYITKPVTGRTPKTAVSAVQYTGTVEWQETGGGPHSGDFAEGKAYTATVTLEAGNGRSFDGVMQNAFIHGDAEETPSNAANSGVVTIKFPETVGAVTVPIGNSWD